MSNGFNDVIYETWVGRDQRRIAITHGEYLHWLERIKSDENLIAGLRTLYDAKLAYGTLDEGSAGTFEHQIHPFLTDIVQKMDHIGSTASNIIAPTLINKAMKDIGFNTEVSL